MLRSIFPLSIGAYTSIFIMTVFMFLGGMSWYALHQVEDLEEQSLQNHRLQAIEELKFTINKIHESGENLGQRFANWDETLQQLSNPTYYTHWRENRVLNSGFAPSYFDAIELYDHKGNLLAPSYDKDIPRNSNNLSLPVLIKQHGHDHFYVKVGIYNDAMKTSVAGYVVLKLDFLQALEELQKFRYADVRTITVTAAEGEAITVNKIISQLEFNTLENTDFHKLQELMVITLNNFALIGFILLLIAAYVVHIIIGNPLRKLSFHIDALRMGRKDVSVEGRPWYQTVDEIEKVRHSLSEYEYQLEEGARALRDSEAQKRTILENVVDAIITINQEGEIISFNQAAERIFGYRVDEVIGKHITYLMEKNARGVYRSYCDRNLNEQSSNARHNTPCELIGMRKNGLSFSMELVVSPMQFAGSSYFVVVARDVSDRKQAEEKLLYLANYDTLTNLPNRILFRDRLAHAMALAARNETMVGLLFLDLDRFKTINDTLGHDVGDELLKEMAKRLQEHARLSDTIARLGGDEFTVIIEDMRHVEEAALVARKICKVMHEPFYIKGQQLYVSTSIGITVYPLDEADADGLLKNADTAMYHAKESGGNTYQFFTPGMNVKALEWLSMEKNLRRAMEKEQFKVFYQPRIDIENNRIVAVEALLRWQQSSGHFLSPNKFIPVLEETGMINNISDWVLDRACADSQHWVEQGFEQLRIAINISPRLFRQQNLAEQITSRIQKSGLAPECLELEITENLLLENIDTAVEILNKLSDERIQIAVDDFGTGYSSLNYLKRLPIDTLKIDRSFVTDVTHDGDAAAIATAIVALARSLGMRITAEGIENEEQLDYLRKLGCHEAQGYYISEALSSNELMKWMKAYNEGLSTVSNLLKR